MTFSQKAVSLLAVIAIHLLAYSLRIYCIDCQSLWLDETASAYWTATPLIELFRDTADNLHVPGYYLLLRTWVALAGDSPFSLRYFSLLGGFLIIPLAFWFARRFLQHGPYALIAALVAALNPALIYYSQETRMYSMLPVIYLLLLALVLKISERPRYWHWIVLAVLQLTALYFHLFSVLMVVAVNIYLLFVYWRRQPGTHFVRSWLGSQLLVALLVLPWLLFLWRSGGALPANLSDTTGGRATLGLGAYFAQVWTFLVTGLTSVRSPLQYWAQLLALVIGPTLVVAVVFARARVRRALIALLVALVIPLVAGSLAWRFNPLSHPRYLFFLATPIILLSAHGLVWIFRHRKLAPLAFAVVTLLLALDIASVRAAWFDSQQHRYDAAALSQAIAARGEQRDIVLMPPFDRSLWYYDPSPVRAANWPFAAGEQSARAAKLGQLLRDKESVFLVEYHDLYSYDLQQQVPFLLEANGHLLEKFVVDRMDVYQFALSGWREPQLLPVDYTCGPARLTGLYYPPQVTPGDAPAIALHWRLDEAIDQTLVASARLMDGDRQLASLDQTLRNRAEQGTESWVPGDEGSTYFVLPFPLGTPPLDYMLEVILYAEDGDPLPCGPDGGGIHLGEISLVEADRRETDAYGSWADTRWQTPANTQIAPGIKLEAFSVRPISLGPAQPVYVTLRWRASADGPPPVTPQLGLQENGTIVDQQEGDLFPRYPSSAWQSGEIYVETRQLTVPPTLNPLQLTLAVDDEMTTLDEVRIDVSALQWQAPPEATQLCAHFNGAGYLRAYDWQMSEDGSRANLVLYWQADNEAPASVSYTVFAQLLAPDLNVIAQQDGLPARGERPTTTWLPREIIADEHTFNVPGALSPETRLNVGLYELSTLERVPAFDCQGNRLPDDSLSLPFSALK